MPQFEVTSPDGRTFQVTAPEGATQEEVLSYAQQHVAELDKPVKAPSWGTVVKSLPSQMLAGAGAANAQLSELSNFEMARQIGEAPLQPGFAETPGGAATGVAPPQNVARKQQQLESAQSALVDKASKTAEAEKKLQEATPENMTFWQKALSTAAQSSLPVLTALAAGPAAPEVALATAGVGGMLMQGGSTFSEAKQAYMKQGLDPIQAGRKAAADSGIDAIFEGVGEALPLRIALKPGTKFFNRLWKTIIAEAGQEGATQVMQDFNAFLSYKPDITVHEAWDNFLLASAAGGLMGGAVGGGGHIVAGPDEKGTITPGNQPQEQPPGQPPAGTPPAGTPPTTPPPTTPEATATPPQATPPAAPPPAALPKAGSGILPTTTAPMSPEAQQLVDNLDTAIPAESITEADVTSAKQHVADFQKAQANPPKPENTVKLAGLDTVVPGQELGASTKSMANAKNYPNENDAVPRSSRTISIGPEGSQGLTLQQVDLTPSTYVVGVPTVDRDANMLGLMRDTMESWRQKYLPNKPLLIFNESLPIGNAIGWHWTNGNVDAITPAPLRYYAQQKQYGFNANAQATFFYNLTHEFGHALTLDRFLSVGLPSKLTQALLNESTQGTVSDQTLAALQVIDPARAAVVQEFNSIKSRVMSGQMTAEDFINEWMGPAKVGRVKQLNRHDYGLPAGSPASMLIDKIISRATKNLGSNVSGDLLQALRGDFLSLPEYLAEQTARYAYQSKWDKASPFNKPSLFAQAFKSLRDTLASFFAEAKQEGIIAPGVKFSEWLDGLSTPGERVAKPGKVKAAPKGKVAKTKPVVKKKAKPKVEKLDHNETTKSVDREATAKKLIASTRATQAITPELAKELRALVDAGDFETFIDTIQPFLEKKVKFELDDEVPEVGKTATVTYIQPAEYPAAWKGQPMTFYAYQDYNGKLYHWNEGDMPFGAPILATAETLHIDTDVVAERIGEGPSGALIYRTEDGDYWIAYPERGIIRAVLDKPIDFTYKGLGKKVVPITPEEGVTFAPVTYIQATEKQAKAPSVMAAARQAWRKQGFRSPFFKSFFGDWEGNPEGSSKVLTANNEPLVVYHASTAKIQTMRGMEPFTRFDRGDIGFHFGTMRAAHNRGMAAEFSVPSASSMLENAGIGGYDLAAFERAAEHGSYIAPFVLNIRNPLNIGFESFRMWFSPIDFLEQLKEDGNSPFTPAEHDALLKELEHVRDTQAPINAINAYPLFKYNWYEPLRMALQRKGYDGVKYINTGEGDISWVAFEPEQVKNLLGNKTFSKSLDFHWELDFDESQPDGYSAGQMAHRFKGMMPNPGAFMRALRHITNLQFKTLQIQQLAHLNPDIVGLNFMVEDNIKFNTYKSFLQADANNIAEEWQHHTGKENFARVNKFLWNEAEGGKLWVNLTKDAKGVWQYGPSETMYEQMRKVGFDMESESGKAMGELILKIKNSLLGHVNEAEKVLTELLAARFANAPIETLRNALIPMRKAIHDIRKRPFLPQGRFGNYILTVSRTKAEGTGKELVWRQAFESEAEWQKAWESAVARKTADEDIRKFTLSDTEYVLMALPQDFIELAASELALSPDQVDTLLNVLQPVRTEKALKPYDLKRLGIKGYSTDVPRSYANFMWHDANMLAKMRFRRRFNRDIQMVTADLNAAKVATTPESLQRTLKLENIERAMQRARDYVMSPPSEAQTARAVVSLGFLAYNVKTAFVNLVWLAASWSDITSRLGQVQGNKVFAKAVRDTYNSLKLTDLNAVKAGSYIDPATMKQLDRAVKEGVLTQSYAYHLAGMANAANLDRMPGYRLLGTFSKAAIDLGMYPFRLTELGTRRVTFLAQLEAAKTKPSGEFDDPYMEAVKNTNQIQGDYSHGNRPEFMRGRFYLGNMKVEAPIAPLVTIFMTFMQLAAFHAYGGYELGLRRKAALRGERPAGLLQSHTMKLLLIMLLLAGYEGMPGAENLLDVLDFAWKRWGGGKNFRQTMREFVQSVGTISPEEASHGLGHDFFGFDISRSVGLGRLVPGVNALTQEGSNVNSTTGNAVWDLMGPLGSVIHWGLETAFGNKPLLQSMGRAPGAIGNLFSSYIWSKDGVRGPNGNLITFDQKTNKLRDLTDAEIFGKALGFNPSIVAQNREIMGEQHDVRMYWTTRKQRILDDNWRATYQKDREAIADVRKAMADYNESLPPEYRSSMRITGKDLFRSIQAHRASQRMLETQGTPNRKVRPMYQDVRKSYGQP